MYHRLLDKRETYGELRKNQLSYARNTLSFNVKIKQMDQTIAFQFKTVQVCPKENKKIRL